MIRLYVSGANASVALTPDGAQNQPLDNDRYSAIQWTSVQEILSASRGRR
ncbi:hypothetical protein GGR92_003024 [Spirosoma lacussanchae]|nr:hypothetical protein [Spirosoma lacussanchae]